jgi:hypothetical protein
MSRTYDVESISVRTSIYEALEAKMKAEGRFGSLTAYASEILNGYINGTLVNKELLRAKIESELRKEIIADLQEIEAFRKPVQAKAHRPAKETLGLKQKAG